MRTEHFTAAGVWTAVSEVMDDPAAQLPERRWGAFLAADVVEYSRLTSLNEEQTYFRYKAHRRELIDPMIAEYRARFVKSTGDGILAEFETVLDAAQCAIQVQRRMAERCKGESDDRRIVFRMGLSCGNVIADKEDIYGHDVNVAARLQTVAPAGGIAMTERVAELVVSSLALPLEDLGVQKFRNMCLPVRVFRYRVPGETDLEIRIEPMA